MNQKIKNPTWRSGVCKIKRSNHSQTKSVNTDYTPLAIPRYSIVDKLNRALSRFGFNSVISRIEPFALNFEKHCSTNGFTRNYNTVNSGFNHNTCLTIWYYLHLKNANDWLFLFGDVNSKKVFHWVNQSNNDQRYPIKKIQKRVKKLVAKVSLENALRGEKWN